MGVGRVPGPANAGDAGGPDVREIVDAMIDGGATLSFDLRADETGPVFVVDGEVEVAADGAGSPVVAAAVACVP